MQIENVKSVHTGVLLSRIWKLALSEKWHFDSHDAGSEDSHNVHLDEVSYLIIDPTHSFILGAALHQDLFPTGLFQHLVTEFDPPAIRGRGSAPMCSDKPSQAIACRAHSAQTFEVSKFD